jgi:chemotaxis protein CheX
VKTTSELLAASTSVHESWSTVIEVAAREVFELMLGCKLSVPQEPFEEVREITAMVGLAGLLCGVMSIRCSIKAATIMASKMLGIEAQNIDREMCDAFGEVCNMIAGNFKNKIARLGNGCMLSVPTVITGGDYNLHSLTDSEALEIRLLFENMPVTISLQIHS